MHLFGCLTFTAVLLATASAQGIQGAVNNIANTASNAINFANSAAGGLTGLNNLGALNTGVLGTGAFNTGVVGTSALNTGVVGTGAFNTGVVGTGAFNTGVVGTGALNTGILGGSTVGTAGAFGVGNSVAGTQFQASPNTQAWNLVDDGSLWNLPSNSLPLTTQNTAGVTFGTPQMIGISTNVLPPLTQLNSVLSQQGIGATSLNTPVTTLYPTEPAYNMQMPLYNSFSNVNTFSTANPGFIVQDTGPVFNTGLFQYPTLFGSNFDMDMDTDLDMNMNSFTPFFQSPTASSQQYVVCAPVTS